MDQIDEDIAAYGEMANALETKHMGKWVLFRDSKLVDIFDSFQSAAEAAVKKFGRGPYLLRQVGAPPVTLPAPVKYRPEHPR